MDAVPSTVGPFGFKFYQVGMYVRDILEGIDNYAGVGYADWSVDSLTHNGLSLDANGKWQPYETYGELAFNYDILPIELELLSFDVRDPRGLTRDRSGSHPIMSHMCVRVEDLGSTVDRMARDQLMTPHVAFVSSNHTNVHMSNHNIAGVYYKMRPMLGYDIKVVQRVSKADNLVASDIVASLLR